MAREQISPENVEGFEIKHKFPGILAGFRKEGKQFVTVSLGRDRETHMWVWNAQTLALESEALLFPQEYFSYLIKWFFLGDSLLALGKQEGELVMVRYNLVQGMQGRQRGEPLLVSGVPTVNEQFKFAVSIGKNGTLLASAINNIPYVINLETGEYRQFKPFFGKHKHWVVNTQISTNNVLLATLDHGGEIKVWDIETGKQKSSLRASLRYGGHFGYLPWFRNLLLSSTVEVGEEEKYAVAKIWDVQRKKVVFASSNLVRLVIPEGMGMGNRLLVKTFATLMYGDTHHDIVSSLDISPNKKTAVTASLDGTVKIWAIRKRKDKVLITVEVGAPCISATFSPDGSALFISVRKEPVGSEKKKSWLRSREDFLSPRKIKAEEETLVGWV